MPPPEIITEDARFVFRMADPLSEGTKIHAFRREAFGRDFEMDHFQWFNLKYPYSHNRVYVAEEKSTGRIASAICMLPFRYRIGRETRHISVATGGATHPNFRGLGLFTKISSMLVEQEGRFKIECAIGFPNPEALPLHIKAGWEVPLELTFLEKREFRQANGAGEPIERFDERYDGLYEESTEHFDFVNLKDHRVLNWRYKERPDVDYQCFETGSPNLEGFIVLKRFQDKEIRKVHIVDFLAANEKAADALIRVAESFSKGSDLLNLWMPPTSPYAEIFFRREFVPSDERSPMILKCRGTAALPPIASPWVVLGDNDVY